MGLALALGIFWVTRRIVRSLRWAIEERPPDRTDQRNTFVAPWRVAKMLLVLWGVGTALLTTLYGLHDTDFIPRFAFAIGFVASWWPPGAICSPSSRCAQSPRRHWRPVPRRVASPPASWAARCSVWVLGSGVPVLGIAVTAVFALSLRNLTQTQFAFAVLIIAASPWSSASS